MTLAHPSLQQMNGELHVRFPAIYCTGIFTTGTLIFTKCWPAAMVICCRDQSGCCRRDIAGRAHQA